MIIVHLRKYTNKISNDNIIRNNNHNHDRNSKIIMRAQTVHVEIHRGNEF